MTPNTPQAMRETPDDIIEFLYGAEPFEGVWYGDGKHPTRKGNYWWRSLLRERIERLESELAAAKRDGERYRWLRDPNNPAAETMFSPDDGDAFFNMLAEEELDKAIDAAIEQDSSHAQR